MYFLNRRRIKKLAWVLLFALLFTFISPNLVLINEYPYLYPQKALAEEKDTKAFISGIILMGLAYLFDRFLNRGSNPPDGHEQDNAPSRIGDIWREQNSHGQSDKKEVLGFFVNWTNPLTLSYPSLQTNSREIDMVAPFWYTLTPEGNLETKYRGQLPEVVNWARKHNQKLIPLINNQDTNYNFLVDERARKKAIGNIIRLVKSQGYDGVNLDFEFIPPWTKDSYTRFIRDLSKELKALGKTVTISVFPKIDVPYQFHGAYDYKALAPYVDKIVIMTYDHHWSSGPPGPIAPIDWVDKNIRYALHYVSADKILLGIANYAYDWPAVHTVSARSISSKEALQLAEKLGARIRWDSESQSPYYYYWEGTQKRVVWLENSYSLRYKLRLVNEYNLAGIAIWRLGNATDRFWQVIKEELK